MIPRSLLLAVNKQVEAGGWPNVTEKSWLIWYVGCR